jgi:hypothetical protein
MDSNLKEKEKYTKAWDHDAYRKYAPGEHMVRHYVTQCRPKKGRLIDFGAGTGRGALALHKLGYEVMMIDIADNCLDDEVRAEIGNRLMIANLWEPLDMPKAGEGYCTDVMEHIPPQHVEAVIENTLKLCDRVFFHICLLEDHFGKELGEHLHLTVRPFTWWRDLISKHGTILDGRDQIENGWFYVQS